MKTLCLCILFVVFPLFLTANFVQNQPFEHIQPDGTKLNLYVTGDEYYHRVHDERNYTVLKHPETGFAVYAIPDGASVKVSDYVVGQTDPAALGIQPGLFKLTELEENSMLPQYRYGPNENTRFTTGLINNIVCFVRFADQTEFPTSRNYLWYNMLFNNTNQQSLKDYYHEVSANQLSFQSYLYPDADVNGYVVSAYIPQNRNYFSPYDAVTNPGGYVDVADKTSRHFYLANTLTIYIDSVIPDQMDVDLDNDGSIDGLNFLIRGPTDGWSDLLWPAHVTWTQPIGYINGVPVNHYVKLLDDPLGSAVICHETGHMIGFPDLYHYTDNGISPVGIWDLMASGPTVHELAHMKLRYGGWFTEIPVITPTSVPTQYTLTAIDQNPYSCYKIASNYPDQYYVLEYRRQAGRYEIGLPSSGLIVSRIIDNYAGLDVIGNAQGPPDEVYVYRPDGNITTDGWIDGATFSSSAGRVEFHNQTNPQPWIFINPSAQMDGNLVITEIGPAGGETITFKVSSAIPAYWLWDGSHDNNWNNPDNWSKNSVPTYDKDVLIPFGTPFYPVITSAVNCNSLTVKSGASLFIDNGHMHVSYDFDNFGNLVMNFPDGQLDAQNITFFSGSTAVVSQPTIEISVWGNLTFHLGSDISIQEGTLIFFGTGNSQLAVNGSASIKNLRLNKTSPYTVTCTSSSATTLTVNGNLDIYSGNNLINNMPGTLAVKGSFSSYSGSFTYCGGNLRLEGNSAAALYSHNAVPITFAGLQIAKTSGALATLNAPVTCSSNLNVSGDGGLVVSNHNLTVNGSLVSAGILQQTGTGDITVTGNVLWNNGASMNVTNSAADLIVQGHMYFQGGSNIDITNGSVVFYGSTSSGIYMFETGKVCHLRNAKSTVAALVGLAETSTHDLYINGDLINQNDMVFRHYSPQTLHLKGNFINGVYSVFYFDAGTLSMEGTSNQSIQSSSSISNYFNNLNFNMASGVTCSLVLANTTSIEVKGNLTINSGIFNCNNRTIRLQGNWTNSMGDMAFTEGDGVVIFNGTGNQYCSTEHFGSLDLNKASGELVFPANCLITCNKYNWTTGAYRVAGGSFTVSERLIQPGIYGPVYLDSGTINYRQSELDRIDLNGNLVITGGTFSVYGGSADFGCAYAANASLTMSGGVLDIKDKRIVLENSAFSLSFNLTGGTIRTALDFRCQRNNVNLAGGTVELYGQQDCLLYMISGTSLHNLSINKASARAVSDGSGDPIRLNGVGADSDILITGNLAVNQGSFDVRTFNLQVNGNLTVYGTLRKNQAGSIVTYGDFNWQTGSMADITAGTITCGRNWRFLAGSTVNLSQITTNLSAGQPVEIVASSPNAWFGTLNINGISMVAQSIFTIVSTGTDALIVKGVLTISGSNAVISEGRPVKTENNVNINANCKLSLGPDASLRLYSGRFLYVNDGGTLEAIGTAGHPATVTQLTTGYYYFNVQSGGTISAEYAVFEYMQSSGVNIQYGALVDNAHPFNFCTFRNGYSGGKLITIANIQSFSAYGVNFPASTIASTFNVYKNVNLGVVTFINAVGAFSGPAYENDPYNRINWTSSACELSINDFWVIDDFPFVCEENSYGIEIYNNSANPSMVPIRIDVYCNRETAPPAGTIGDAFIYVEPLGAWDAVSVEILPVPSFVPATWKTWFRVDTLNEINETNEANNADGYVTTVWLALPVVTIQTISYNQATQTLQLTWTYPDEPDIDRFKIYRSDSPYGPFDLLIGTASATARAYYGSATEPRSFYQVRAEKTWE